MPAVTQSTGRAARDAGRSGPQKLSAPIARWVADRDLKIVATSHGAKTPLRTLPSVGQVISPARRRTGILERNAHRRALRGVACDYTLHLFRRAYRVDLAPRLDRKKRIIGVRGMLRQLSDVDKNPGASAALGQLLERRHRNSFRSAVQALELAKSLSDAARVKAEILIAQARGRQQRAVQDQRARSACWPRRARSSKRIST
jgi:hypothetical protein